MAGVTVWASAPVDFLYARLYFVRAFEQGCGVEGFLFITCCEALQCIHFLLEAKSPCMQPSSQSYLLQSLRLRRTFPWGIRDHISQKVLLALWD